MQIIYASSFSSVSKNVSFHKFWSLHQVKVFHDFFLTKFLLRKDIFTTQLNMQRLIYK